MSRFEAIVQATAPNRVGAFRVSTDIDEETPYANLSGSGFAARMRNAPAGRVATLPAGEYTWSDFPTNDQGVWSGVLQKGGGIRGAGTLRTILRPVANSSTQAGRVPATGTNPLYLMTFTQPDLVLSDFTLEGAPQGHLYGGIRLHLVDRATVRRLRLVGAAPGNDKVPPGETFDIAPYGGNGHLYEDVVIDGRGAGASAFGANGQGSTDGFRDYVWRRCSAYDHPYSAAFALWQGAGTHWLIDCYSNTNRTAINLERVGQEETRGAGAASTVNAVNFTFGAIVAGGQDLFVNNDRGSTVVNIYDPIGRDVQNPIRAFHAAREQGNPNRQKRSDIRVFKGGRWSGGLPGLGTYVGGTEVTSTHLVFFGSGV